MKPVAIVVWILLLVWLVAGAIGGVVLLLRPPGDQRALVAAEATLAFLPAIALLGGALALLTTYLMTRKNRNPYAAQAFAVLFLIATSVLSVGGAVALFLWAWLRTG